MTVLANEGKKAYKSLNCYQPPVARVSKKEYVFMEPALDFLQNVISPQQEMSAYETLWAIKGLREPDLRQLFEVADYIPSQALRRAGQTKGKLFELKQINELKAAVNNFFMQLSLREVFSVTIKGSIQYPSKLAGARYPLGLLYYKGHLDLVNTKCISVIGTRKPSDDGIKQTKNVVKDLVSDGWTIVSGLAKGIDTVAHQSAIEHHGNTIGVIGTPIHKYYPKENKELQDKIATDFLLLSQVPFYRYEKEPFNHHAYHFPRRNRVMASISSATVIMDVSENTKGSEVQAMECLRQNKKLFIYNSLFTGSDIHWLNRCEKKGAIRIKTAKDIFSKMGNHIKESSSHSPYAMQLSWM